ncbi:hypothetical protein SAMN05421858_3777 [Haladaptatus litoreus]|uniref:Uncharacterized protein n=1 Tax=Haladaptatus litoreus TaxID=553468 RepID=A0A1N7DNM4_9EURY|nr:hypothetical protein SAMN05421858_3777 [Haladaptatus litoreus]
MAVILSTMECREVVVQPLDDLLENFRVNLFQVAPPLLELGASLLFGVCRGSVVLIQVVEKVVVDLSTSIDSPC